MLLSIRLSSTSNGKHNLMPPGRQVLLESKSDPKAYVGEGDVKWKEVFALLEKSGGTEWYIVEYEVEGMPPLGSVKRCLENLHKMGM
jgi:sugar phosphate isomerase/epimerase